LIGGIPESQEMLDFCAERGITCDIELIKMDYINKAYERMLKSDVRFRFLIDIASLCSLPLFTITFDVVDLHPARLVICERLWMIAVTRVYPNTRWRRRHLPRLLDCAGQ
jgi:hypothetical protein